MSRSWTCVILIFLGCVVPASSGAQEIDKKKILSSIALFREAFQLGHTPAFWELHLGDSWKCQTLAFARVGNEVKISLKEAAPRQFQVFSENQRSYFIRGFEQQIYITSYEDNGIIFSDGSLLDVIRVRNGMLISEMSVDAKVVEALRYDGFPPSLFGSRRAATAYTLCESGDQK